MADFPTGLELLLAEIQANKPLTQDLMDKIRLRADHLISIIVPLGGTGVDGPVNLTSSITWGAGASVDYIIDCTTFNIDSSTTLTALPGTTIIIRATESITIDGTIDANGKGAAGGAGGPANGFDGVNGNDGIGGSGGAGGANASTGKGGDSFFQGFIVLAGGTITGGDGNDGNDIDDAYARMIQFGLPFIKGGAGGGGGRNEAGGNPGIGGDGGGMISLESPIITVNGGGIVRANGLNGTAATASNSGSGGGGGGGFIKIKTTTYTNNGTISVTGGTGGVSNNSGGNGGAGKLITEIL